MCAHTSPETPAPTIAILMRVLQRQTFPELSNSTIPFTGQRDGDETADASCLPCATFAPRPRVASMIGPLLDTILDRTVIAGYTRVGYRMRRGMWSPVEEQPMGGKVVLLTGGTSGLGLAAAEGF